MKTCVMKKRAAADPPIGSRSIDSLAIVTASGHGVQRARDPSSQVRRGPRPRTPGRANSREPTRDRPNTVAPSSNRAPDKASRTRLRVVEHRYRRQPKRPGVARKARRRPEALRLTSAWEVTCFCFSYVTSCGVRRNRIDHGYVPVERAAE
jgi:hypothetical protein